MEFRKWRNKFINFCRSFAILDLQTFYRVLVLPFFYSEFHNRIRVKLNIFLSSVPFILPLVGIQSLRTFSIKVTQEPSLPSSFFPPHDRSTILQYSLTDFNIAQLFQNGGDQFVVFLSESWNWKRLLRRINFLVSQAIKIIEVYSNEWNDEVSRKMYTS